MLFSDAVNNRDAVNYIPYELEFHRTLYLRAQDRDARMAETVWCRWGRRMARALCRCDGKTRPHFHNKADYSAACARG